MTARRPFENRELIATKNLLSCVATNTHYLKVLMDSRWNFPGDLTISFLYKHNGVPSGNQIVLLTDDTKASYIFFITLSATPNIPLIQVKTTSGNYFNVNSDSIPSDITKDIVRVTITRISNVFYCYFNARMVESITASGNVNLSLSEYLALGGGFGTASKMNGYVSNLVALNGRGMTQSEIDSFHHTNTIPKSCHAYVIAHYPLNQDNGDIAYDAVEQYNYAKHISVNLPTVAASNFNFLATNGNTASKTDGSDSDGNYVEFVFTNKEDTPHLVIQPIGATVITAFYKIEMKFKFVASVADNNFQYNLDDSGTNVTVFLQSTHGTTVKTIIFPQISYYNLSSGTYTSYLAFHTGGYSGGVEGATFRLYSLKVSGILTANHADLINFANNDVGVPNLLSQTSWQNFYETKKKGQFVLKGNDTNMYAQIPSYAVTPSTWSIYVECTQSITAVTYETAFCGADTENVKLTIFIVGSQAILVSYKPHELYNGSPKPNIGTNIHKIWIVYDGTQARAYINGVTYGAYTATNWGFDFFRFFRQNSGNELYTSEGVCRSVFLNRLATDHERYAIENNLLEYKNFSGIQFDLDFGDIFVQSGNYMIRDHSSNARHAQLYNYDPTTNQPVLLEQSSQLPPITKALKFNGTNQYLQITNFNPTEEKGYTYIIGIKLVKSATDHITWDKGSGGGAWGKTIYQITNSNEVKFGNAALNGITINYKADGLITYGFDEISLGSAGGGLDIVKRKAYVNGHFFATDSSNTQYHGFDEIAGDLTIGCGSGGSGGGRYGFFDQYIFLIAIWKGILTSAQHSDIVNNLFGKNPSPLLMTDCQLYLNFDKIIRPVDDILFQETSPILGDFPYITGDGIITYGSDSDGNYIQLEYVTGSPSVTSIWSTKVPNRAFYATIKYKIITGQKGKIQIGGGPVGLDAVGTVNVLITANTNTAVGYSENVRVALYFDGGTSPTAGDKFRLYSAIVYYANPAIKDYSPQNRVVEMKNFSANEVDPAHANYRLIELDALRTSIFPTLPSSILAKTWGWYDINDRSQLKIVGNYDEISGYYNKLGNTSRNFLASTIASAFRPRRFKNQNFYTCKYEYNSTTQSILPSPLTAKIMNWLHDGTTGYFISFLISVPQVMGSPMAIVRTCPGDNKGFICSIFASPGTAGKFGFQGVIHSGTANVCYRYVEVDQNKIHLIVITFDPSLGSNNMKIYVDGVEGSYIYGSAGSIVASYGTGDSSEFPTIFERQADTTTDQIYAGEIIIGNQLLISGEFDDLHEYYTTKYGTFPQPL
jgi:hypothetical protein